MANSRRTYQSVGEHLESVRSCCNIRKIRRHVRHAPPDASMLVSCVRGVLVGEHVNASRIRHSKGSTAAARRSHGGTRRPTCRRRSNCTYRQLINLGWYKRSEARHHGHDRHAQDTALRQGPGWHADALTGQGRNRAIRAI